MNRVEAALRRIAADLDATQVPWALVCGFAVSARAEPRFTRDVDVAVGIEAEVVAAADVLEVLPGLPVPVASAAHLVSQRSTGSAE